MKLSKLWYGIKRAGCQIWQFVVIYVQHQHLYYSSVMTSIRMINYWETWSLILILVKYLLIFYIFKITHSTPLSHFPHPPHLHKEIYRKCYYQMKRTDFSWFVCLLNWHLEPFSTQMTYWVLFQNNFRPHMTKNNLTRNPSFTHYNDVIYKGLAMKRRLSNGLEHSRPFCSKFPFKDNG